MWCTTVAVEVLGHVRQNLQEVAFVAIAVRMYSTSIQGFFDFVGILDAWNPRLECSERDFSGILERGIREACAPLFNNFQILRVLARANQDFSTAHEAGGERSIHDTL